MKPRYWNRHFWTPIKTQKFKAEKNYVRFLIQQDFLKSQVSLTSSCTKTLSPPLGTAFNPSICLLGQITCLHLPPDTFSEGQQSTTWTLLQLFHGCCLVQNRRFTRVRLTKGLYIAPKSAKLSPAVKEPNTSQISLPLWDNELDYFLS